MIRLKKLGLLVVMLIPAFGTYSQSVSYFGTVSDSLNTHIEFANVVALDPFMNKIASFGITSGEGKFKLILQEGKTYNLKISYMGYHTYEREIEGVSNVKNPLEVILKAKDMLLDAAEVIHEMPVIISGDTITYKADAFTNGRERKLKDVLEKLPGFEVDENGEVKVQGQKVNKLMVDGKDFFDGDTKMGTKNIPANAVERVQVLKDFNEISPMKGLDNNENLALNIQLKEGKKNMVFGDLTAGTGPELRYISHVNSFYYSPKTSVNLISDLNNVGELAFTIQDYFRFSGGLSGLSNRAGSSVSITSDDFGIPMAQRNNAIDLKTKLGALNLTYRPDYRWLHSGFLIGSESNNVLGSNSFRTYIREEADNEERLVSSNRVNQRSGLLKYATTYTPNKKTYAKYSLFGKIAANDNSNSQFSEIGSFNNSISIRNKQHPSSIDQQLQFFHTPNDKHVFSMEIGYQFKFQDPLMDLGTSVLPFDGIIPVVEQERYQLLNNLKISTYKQESIFNYYRILNPKNHLNFSVGNNRTRQKMSSTIQQVIQREEIISIEESNLSNDLDYEFDDFFAGISLKTKVKKLVISPGVNLHYFRLHDFQFGTENLQNKVIMLPNLFAKFQIRNSQSLSFNFRSEAAFVDVQKLAAGLVIRDYNSLFIGNRNLENGLYQRFGLNYNHFNMFSAYNIFGAVDYQKKLDDLVNTVSFVGLERINSLVNVEDVNESLSGRIQGDKRFNSWKIKASSSFSVANTNNFVNEKSNFNRNFSQDHSSSIMTTLFRKMDLEMGFGWVYNAYQTDRIKNTFTTHRPFAKITYAFVDDFALKADYEYNRYKNRGTNMSSSFDFLNAELVYQKKGSDWEFKASVFNALDTRSIRSDSFNESLISTFEYFVQKRYFLLTVKYDL